MIWFWNLLQEKVLERANTKSQSKVDGSTYNWLKNRSMYHYLFRCHLKLHQFESHLSAMCFFFLMDWIVDTYVVKPFVVWGSFISRSKKLNFALLRLSSLCFHNTFPSQQLKSRNKSHSLSLSLSTHSHILPSNSNGCHSGTQWLPLCFFVAN